MRRRLVLLVLAALLVGCAPPVEAIRVQIDPVITRPPLVAPVPATVGVYVDPSLLAFEVEEVVVERRRSGAVRKFVTYQLPLGPASITLFDQVFAARFARTIQVAAPPPWPQGAAPKPAVDAVITVRIVAATRRRIVYGFTFWWPDGRPIASWRVEGRSQRLRLSDPGARAAAELRRAVRAAAALFLIDFETQPGVGRWRAGLAMHNGAGTPAPKEAPRP